MYRLKFLLLLWLLVIVGQLYAAEKYALLIGINDYQSPKIRDLNYSEVDAIYLKDALTKHARFKPENVKILLGNDASYQNIKKEVYWLGSVAKKDDQVFFYFSGHGSRVEDMDKNEEDGMDEAFCPYDTDISNPASLILDDEIGHWFRRITSKEVIVVLDCCHSGGAAGRSLENDGSRGLEMSNAPAGKGLMHPDDDPYAKDLTLDNKFIMTASDADEQSYENPQLGHGVFTYYLGEAIRGNADTDNNQIISVKEMYDYTHSRTIDFAKSIKRKQTPFQFGALNDAVIAQLNNQICEIKLFDRDLKIVGLGIGGGAVRKGDVFLIKKNLKGGARDLEIADRDIFKIEITDVRNNFSEGQIVEEFYKNINIDPSQYTDYYAVRLSSGTLVIQTTPWSTVYLDGKKIGETPLTITDVPAGEHEIEFKIDVMGYPTSIVKKMNVTGNQKNIIAEKFAKSK